jgi:predicted PurR-regulated permease PerM
MSEQKQNHVPPSNKPAEGTPTVAITTEPGLTPVLDVRNLALTVVAVLAVVLVLQYAQSVLIPIVIGILISYGLAPFVGGLQRIRVPRAIGAAVAVVMLVGTLGLAVYTLSDQAMAVVADVPQAAQRFRERIRENRRKPAGALARVQEAAKEIDKAAHEASAPTAAESRTERAVQEATGVQKVEIVEAPFRATDYLWSPLPRSSCSSCFSSTSSW